MRALLLIAHTSPSLVVNIIRNKLGKNALVVDPKDNEAGAELMLFSSFRKAKAAINSKKYPKSVCISLCSPLDAKQVRGAELLDFTTETVLFNAAPFCKFDIIFDYYADKKRKSRIKFKNKSLLKKIIDFKMSTNIISLGQTLLYDIAVKSKRKQLRKIIIAWLSFTPTTRPNIQEYILKHDNNFKPMPKSLKKKFDTWQVVDKNAPVLYAKFLQEAKGKANKDIALIATKYGIGSFDGITLVSWLKGL